MIYLVFLLLLLAAVACLGLSRALPTQVLGFIAACITLIAAVLLLIGHGQDTPPLLQPLTWVSLEQITILFSPQLDTAGVLLSCTLLGGGALALLALALALAPTVRGFGGLFAWVLLTLAAALLGLSSEGFVVPFAWALVAILSYCAARSSGALNRSEGMPNGITIGLLASLLLLAGLIAAAPAVAVQIRPPSSALVCVVVACLMFMGAAPFHNALDEAVQAPAALGALLYGLVFPIVATDTLLRFIGDMRAFLPGVDLPLLWRVLLLVMGLFSVFAGAVGALREHRLQRLLAWQAGAQGGLVVLALGVSGPLAALAAPALLVNLALTTLGGALAVTVVERLTGLDDFTRVQPGADLRWPGLVWAITAASALGMPSLWGFWARSWLFEALVAQAPWAAAPVLAASVLMALAYLAPLACFWWRSSTDMAAGAREHAIQLAAEAPLTGKNPFLLVLVLVPLPLLVMGLAPQLVWDGLLRMLPAAPAALPVSTTAQAISVAVAALSVLLLLLPRLPSARRSLPDDDMLPAMLAPDALAGRLSLLETLGRPASLLRGAWDMLLSLAQLVRAGMTLFEQRFYLAGVLLGLISLILLMVQG